MPERSSNHELDLSILVPVLNEVQNVSLLYERLKATLDGGAYSYEIVFTDNGSTDGTIDAVAKLTRLDPRVGLVCLSRNWGYQASIQSGIDHSTGRAVVVIDGDLQDPPELIPKLLQRWEEGYSVVYGIRTRREGERVWRRVAMRLFYRLLHKLSDVQIPVDAGDFRLLDRRVVEVLQQLPERNRYIRGLVAWIGFRQVGVPYARAGRAGGRSKYPFFQLLLTAVDGITGFSTRPLRLAYALGILSAFAALGIGGWAVGLRLAGSSRLPGWASLMAVLSMFFSLHFFLLGVIGEYTGRLYFEAKRRPLYVVADRHGVVADRRPHGSSADRVR